MFFYGLMCNKTCYFSGRGSVDRSSFSALNASGMVRNQNIVKQTLERLNLEAKSKGQSSPVGNRRQTNPTTPTPIVPMGQPIRNASSTGGQNDSSGAGNVINITPYGEGEDQSFTVNVNYDESLDNPNFQNQTQFNPNQGQQQFNNQGQYSTPLIENNAGLDNIVLGEPISLGGSGDPYGGMYGGSNVNGPSTDQMFSPNPANAPQAQATPIGGFDSGGNVFDPSAPPAPGGGNVFDPSVAPNLDPLAEVGTLELELPDDMQAPFIGKKFHCHSS